MKYDSWVASDKKFLNSDLLIPTIASLLLQSKFNPWAVSQKNGYFAPAGNQNVMKIFSNIRVSTF